MRFYILGFLLIFLVFFPLRLIAQKKADSLLIIADRYKQQNDLSNALRYSLQAIKEFEKINAKDRLTETYLEIGQVYENGNLFEKALEYFLKANQNSDDIRIQEYIAQTYLKINRYKDALSIYQKILPIYEKQVSTNAILNTYRNMVISYKKLNEYEKALSLNLKILDLYTQLNDEEGITTALNNLGYNYKYLGKYPQALKYFQETLAQKNKMGADKSEQIPTLINLAVTYQNLGDYNNALKYILDAFNLLEKQGDKDEIARLDDLIAIIYLNMKDLYNAAVYNDNAIELAMAIPDADILQAAYKTKSMILQEDEDYKEALRYYQMHLEIKDSLRLEELLGQEKLLREQFIIERTEKELQLLLVDEEMKDLAMKQLMLENEKKAKDFELLKRDKDLQDASFRQKELEQQRALQELLIKEQRFETEKKGRAIILLEKDKELQRIALKQKEAEDKEKQRAIELLTKDKEIQDLEISRREEEEKQAIYFVISVSIFFAIVFLLILVGLIITRRANRKLAFQKKEIENINEELVVKQEEIQSQRDAIVVKNEQLNELYTDITESINYASRIQSAILPLDEQMMKSIPEHFILFKPRDVVSGDFYWFTESESRTLQEEKTDFEGKKTMVNGFSNTKIILAVVDCTGHGVPGAFMTMIANDLLTDIVVEKKINEPEKILNELHVGVRRILKQGESDNRDGMDIALISIDKINNTVRFAGAKNPLIYIQNKELFHIKGDKMPVGGEQTEKERIFTGYDIPINSSKTLFYLFSDGYQDQFGGEYNKKFMVANLKNLLLEIHQKPMEEQKKILNESIENWISKGNERQIDDILLIGLKL